MVIAAIKLIGFMATALSIISSGAKGVPSR
jgi:hypothetical protein